MADTPEDPPGPAGGNEAADRADRKPQRATKADDDQPQEPAAEKGQESSPDAEDEPLDLHERRAARAALVNMSGGVGVGLAGPSDINAPVAGRDQTVIYHNYAAEQIRAKVVTGTVTHEFLDQLADVYVKPSVYGEAREILKSRHVLVLYGRARSGKWMTALHLLCELKANEICSLPPDEDVRRLGTDDEFGSGFGYYAVDTLAPVQARQLNEFHLNTLSDRFRASRKYLTITVNSGAVRRHELPADFVVSCEQPPDAAQVLSKHLRASLDEARCAKLIAYPPVQAFLQRAFFQPHDVVALVAVLVKASQDGSNLDDALARFDENVVEDVKKWFHDHAELSKYGDRAFMVAMAVFNGAPYQDVLDVAARLEARFLEIEEPENPGRKQLFLAMKRDQLEDACAHSVRIEEVRSVGAMQVEAVEFIDPRYAPIVLDTVWQHPAARGPLLAWLQDLAAHPSVRIRVRAAMAIGRISTYGFGYIQDEILSGWARKPDYRLRQSVARILTIPALDPALAPVVRALLREWSDRDSSRWRKLTAATAYGTEVGMLFPDTALRGLERIATGDDDDDLISLVVSYSITNLFEAGHQDEVLDALLAWTAPGRESRERTRQRVLSKNGLVAFFRIAKEGVVEPPPAQEGWPHFLAVSHGNASRMQRLVSLWRRALDTKPMARNALDVLRGWARKANYDQRLQEVLWSLVDALAETEQETERLTYNLRRWAEDTREPSRAAAYILEKLSQRGTRDVE